MKVLQLVDLSRPVGGDTVVYPGDPHPSLRPYSRIADDGFNLLEVQIGSQSGTHLDAPYHFEEDGLRIDEIDLRRTVGTAIVADVTGLAPRTPITWDLLARQPGRLTPGTIVLLRTGWDAHYGTPRYFEHPYLEEGACRRLVDLGVRAIGIDAINLDETPDADHPGVGYPCHHLIAGVDGVIAENLAHLDEVTWPAPFVSLLPIRLERADGAPVRAVAMELAP